MKFIIVERNLFTAFLLLFALTACKSESTRALDSSYADLVPVIDSIMQTLDTWTSSKKVKKDAVENVVQGSLRAIREKRLGLTLNPDLPENFFEGLHFGYNPKATDPEPNIAIGAYVLRSFKQYPTITLSAVVHEMQHAQSFLQNPDRFRWVEGNLLEKYLYELDAYNIEARFILKYLAKNTRYQITEFEALLARSFQNNYLDEFSAKMLAHDMRVAMFLGALASKKISETEMLKKIENLLNSVISTEFKQGDRDEDVYFKLVPYHTVNQFLPFTMRDIYYQSRNIQSAPAFDFAMNYPKIWKSYVQISEILQANRDFYFGFAKRSRRYYTRL